MNAAAEARLRRIFNQAPIMTVVTADEMLTDKQIAKACELAAKLAANKSETGRSGGGPARGRARHRPAADNVVHFMPGLDTPDGQPTDPSAA